MEPKVNKEGKPKLIISPKIEMELSRIFDLGQ